MKASYLRDDAWGVQDERQDDGRPESRIRPIDGPPAEWGAGVSSRQRHTDTLAVKNRRKSYPVLAKPSTAFNAVENFMEATGLVTSRTLQADTSYHIKLANYHGAFSHCRRRKPKKGLLLARS
uniref:Uncharacterized protein n=1 Tax=Plectus sambesii TaxID=2011161 RepID=A0A914W5L6_9BILA